MRKSLFNPILVFAFAGAFLFGSVVCCCIKQLAKKVEASCCHKTAKADPVKCKDGCSSLVKSAEVSKVFDLGSPVFVQMGLETKQMSFKPVHIAKPVFLNGPPGPIAVVPLYTRFHSLRI